MQFADGNQWVEAFYEEVLIHSLFLCSRGETRKVDATKSKIHCVANVYAVLPVSTVKCLCSGGQE